MWLAILASDLFCWSMVDAGISSSVFTFIALSTVWQSMYSSLISIFPDISHILRWHIIKSELYMFLKKTTIIKTNL